MASFVREIMATLQKRQSVLHRRMKAVRHAATAPEIKVRRILQELGLRLTYNDATLPGRPDLASHSRRLAVFVHGCFWHQHEGCRRATLPRSNTSAWLRKFQRNIARDRRNRRDLRRIGFAVWTVWECQVEDERSLRKRLRRLLLVLKRRPQSR